MSYVVEFVNSFRNERLLVKNEVTITLGTRDWKKPNTTQNRFQKVCNRGALHLCRGA